jgi:hypothetical protein
MLSAAKHLDAHPLSPYGILDLCLRLMHITADLSALGGCSDISIKKFICIIGPWWMTWAVQWLHASFVCTITFGIAWPVGHEKEGGDERQYV